MGGIKMKSIKERASERYPEQGILGAERRAFVAGANSEHEELTRWNSPDVLPDINQWIIIKIVNENNGVLYYTTTKFYSEYFNELKECRYTILGWREIHE